MIRKILQKLREREFRKREEAVLEERLRWKQWKSRVLLNTNTKECCGRIFDRDSFINHVAKEHPLTHIEYQEEAN